MNLFHPDFPDGMVATHPEMLRISQEGNLFRIEIPDGELLFSPDFMEKPLADHLMDSLLSAADFDWKTGEPLKMDPENIHWKFVEWRHEPIKIFGKAVMQPRFTACYGDPHTTYTYSGRTMYAHYWTPPLMKIKKMIEPMAGHSFNFVLLNWYRDGSDSMGWHADNESELGQNPLIASVNLGASRRFILRQNRDHKVKIEFNLGHGSALIMAGATQHHWQHAVPKTKQKKGSRVNLTFRRIVG